MKHTYLLTATTASVMLLGGCGKEQTQRPNILFCIADDATFYQFAQAGCTWVNTPNFNKVAQNGLFFQNCYTPNAKSAPSRACVLTGRNSWQLEEAANHISNFPAWYEVFPETLSKNGYAVAFTGKGWGPGNAGMVNGKPRLLTGKPYQRRHIEKKTSGISNCDYASNFADFLDDMQGSESPWFFWYGGYEPHREYEYGTGVSLGGKSIESIEEVPTFLPDNDIVRNDLLDYAFEIEHFDNHLGMMLDELEKRGELSNTIIVVTADNGMSFPRCKANNYEWANHMPCAIMWADGIKNSGRQVDDYVSFIDFAPTFLDVAKVAKSDMHTPSGRSLLPIFKRRGDKIEEGRNSIILGRERDDYGRRGNQGYPIRSIIKDGMLYNMNLKPELEPAGEELTGYLDIDGSPTKTVILQQHLSGDDHYFNLSFTKRDAEELYDLRKDQYCMNNLAQAPGYSDIKSSLKEELLQRLIEQEDPRMGDNGDIFDKYPFHKDNMWNFYERVKSGEITQPWLQTDWVSPSDYSNYVE